MAKDSFNGRLVLVTGGSSGIGLSLARLLAEEGANVWLLARRKDVLEAAYNSLSTARGQKHGWVSADVTKWEQVKAAVDRIHREAGVPDVLINAAGAARPGYVQELPLETFYDMMSLNYFGTVHTVKALLSAMLERGQGYILNVSSGAGFLAPFGYANYVPSKYAVRGLSDSLRLELKPLGIRVSVVFPPDTDTPGLANENKTKPYETLEAFSSQVVSADAVAKSILKGMQRGQYVILPGSEIGLYYRLVFLVGNAIYPIMDMILAQARKKKQKL
ncbi:MAG TPA: SDR family oxidoreductase [Anaerolineales bacterium]|nr:SDR family oxidoreductase [Anaerolineales bacterium]